MPYNTKLANRIRAYLATIPHLEIEEKEMFRGLSFYNLCSISFVLILAVTESKLALNQFGNRSEEIADSISP